MSFVKKGSGAAKALSTVVKRQIGHAPPVAAHTALLPPGNEPLGGRYRVWNHNLPPTKGVAFSFMSLYGIGRTQAFRLCGDLGLNPFQKLDHIPETDFEVIKSKIETTFEPQHAVMKRMGDNILAKVRMGSYQGLRHQMCLPCHGQRTRSNAKTQRKLGQRRAELFNIPLLSKKAKQNIGSGGIAAGSKK